MHIADEYVAYVVAQLGGLGGVAARPMFGGVGLYASDRIFGVIFRRTLYFKVNDATRADYESRGMARFRPFPDRPAASMGYYEVPAEVLEDPELCAQWARRAADGPGEAPKPRERRARSRQR